MTAIASLYNILKAWKQKKEWAFYILLIFLSMSLAAIMDILYYNHIIKVGPFTGYAMYLGIILQGMMLINRYTKNLKQVKHLSRNYHRANMALVSNEQKILEQNQRLNQMAFIDQLTKIPNRVQMVDILGDKLEMAKRENSLLCLLYVDIDNFKRINDTLGQHIGDTTLYLFAQHLKNLLRKSDSLFRMTSDEFIIIAENIKRKEQIVQLSEKILRSFQGVFMVDQHEIYLTLSIGIAYWEKGMAEERIHSLVRKSDIAVGKAKELGKNGYVFYSEDMDKELAFRVNLEEKMHSALKGNRFQLFYQAQIDIRTGKLHGFEALIRWKDVNEGLIAPSQFIPLAEQSNLIIEIGNWILNESCRQLKEWLSRGYRDFSLSVNLSARQFEREDLVSNIASLIEKWNIPPGYLILELTESSLMMDAVLICERMKQLKKLGLMIAVDDFGTGYSNLSYLTSFPIDILKIDKVFITNIRKNEKDRRLVIAIINIARSLDLEIVAEGVETEMDKDLLFSQGCYCIQGYLYAKPEPSQRAEEYFNKTM